MRCSSLARLEAQCRRIDSQEDARDPQIVEALGGCDACSRRMTSRQAGGNWRVSSASKLGPSYLGRYISKWFKSYQQTQVGRGERCLHRYLHIYVAGNLILPTSPADRYTTVQLLESQQTSAGLRSVTSPPRGSSS